MNEQTVDYAVLRERLANLKIDEADLLREAAEMERNLAAKEGEILKLRRQIENMTAQIYEGGGYSHSQTNRVAQFTLPGGTRVNAAVVSAEPIGTVKKPGRPKREDIENAGGNSGQDSLPTIIEKTLNESPEGLSLADLVVKIRSSGYVSLSKNFRSMLDQALGRLKKKNKVVRNPENLRFFLQKEAA
jgi:hypothetical protein